MERVTDKEYWMDTYLKNNLDTLLYNIRDDWDFMLLISGDGMVRVGKSELGQQIAYYVAYSLGTPFTVDNICFSGDELREQAHKLPKNSVLVYDEARGELDSKKLMEKITKGLLDFFAECGMYNHLLILIMPDYFEFPKSIAINRSDVLINVFRKKKEKSLSDGRIINEYIRGGFQFFDRKSKKKLYIEGKRRFDDYDAATPNFFGEFRKFDVIDRDAYLAKKLAFLRRDRGKAKDDERFAAALVLLAETYTQRELSSKLRDVGLDLTQPRINQLITGYKKRNAKESDL